MNSTSLGDYYASLKSANLNVCTADAWHGTSKEAVERLQNALHRLFTYLKTQPSFSPISDTTTHRHYEEYAQYPLHLCHSNARYQKFAYNFHA